MTIFEQLSAIMILIDFLFGVACGVIGGVSHGSRREDRKYTLLRAAPDAVSDGARLICGLYRRDDDGYLQSLLPPGGGGTDRRPRGGRSSAAPEQELDR